MKKTYINPEISNVLMGMEAILTNSFDDKLDDENKIDAEDMLSRRYRRTVWDDEEAFDEEEF